jgi:hypothetical protein
VCVSAPGEGLFENFEQALLYLSHNQRKMRNFLGGAAVAFLLVSSPKPEALEETFGN